ncbi:hypothetical protein MTR_2g023400 [Medicago truncatula]|uniref:Uncharacterized protein n=1 Tax=Medicago truncatula TaxID=3880 RepID=A0A072V502_MEDTR|nr:hypothetical protein MTR_2g023400 [Medicago truncatula]
MSDGAVIWAFVSSGTTDVTGWCKIQCLILENEIEKYNPKIVPIDDYDVSDDATDIMEAKILN